MPSRPASSISRRVTPAAPSLLILQLDTARLRVDGLHLGDMTRLVSLVGSIASGATVTIKEMTGEREFLDALAGLAREERHFDAFVAIGHSNETGIRVASDRFVAWDAFANCEALRAEEAHACGLPSRTLARGGGPVPQAPQAAPHLRLPGQRLQGPGDILLLPDEPPAVIDWEYAMQGGPAYDLAIVTRGVRQPFQLGHGLDRLLDAYATRAPRPVTASEVHLYELCLVGRWYRAGVEARRGREPEHLLGQVRNILARARMAEARERTGGVVSPPT